MRKKLLVLLLAILLLLPVFGGSAAADEKLSFISINDTLPPELIGCVATYGGTTYVPYYIFTSYGFGLYYSYFSGNATAYLYSGDKQLFFELGTGATYDGDDYKYSVSAIMRSGTVYVPLGFTARFFGGVNYSSIAGNEYGSILRITDGTEVLTDAEFLRAAKSVMRSYALAYQTPAQETPLPTEPAPPSDIHEGEQIDLSFIGLPAEGILERLTLSRASACFFLTEAEVRSAPDAVRQLVCSGHTLGVYCTSDLEAEYAAVSELLFAAARVRTELVTAEASYADACRTQAEAAGLVYCGFDLDAPGSDSIYTVTARLEVSSGGASLLLGGGAADATSLGIVLRYLQSGKFNAGAPRETG